MNQAIETALSKLDHDNDEHWTATGLPRASAVNSFLDESVTAKDILKASPDFRRVNSNNSGISGADSSQSNEPKTSKNDDNSDDQRQDASLQEDSESVEFSLDDLDYDEEDADHMKAIVKNIDSMISKIDADVVELGKLKAKLYAKQTEVVEKLYKIPNEGPMDATQRYLKSLAKMREKKAARYRAFKATNIDVKELKELIDPRSKLDAKIAQQNIANRKARAHV